MSKKLLYAFSMTVQVAQEFYRRVEEYKADTPADREAILVQMVHEGLIRDVVVTERSREQYVADLQKNFNVLDVSKKKKGKKSHE